MNFAFWDDYHSRRSQVRRYLAVVMWAERKMRIGGGRKMETDRLHVLRAGTFLILYNLVEASARGALDAIYDTMLTNRIRFEDLNAEIRREVVKGFIRNAKPDVHAMMTDVPVEFVAASLDAEHHFSGNVDARLIRNIAKSYGFSVDTDMARTRGGQDLLTVKNHRNDLAHGAKTYDEVGRNFTARELLEIGLRTMAYVEGILANVRDYLEKGGYLQTAIAPDASGPK